MSLSHTVVFVTPSVPRLIARPRLILAALAAVTLSSGAAAAAEPENILAGKRPQAAKGVTNAPRLTDGLLSNEGDEWLTDVTARFTSVTSFVEERWILAEASR